MGRKARRRLSTRTVRIARVRASPLNADCPRRNLESVPTLIAMLSIHDRCLGRRHLGRQSLTSHPMRTPNALVWGANGPLLKKPGHRPWACRRLDGGAQSVLLVWAAA